MYYWCSNTFLLHAVGHLAYPLWCMHPTLETTDLYHAATLLHKVCWFCHVWDCPKNQIHPWQFATESFGFSISVVAGLWLFTFWEGWLFLLWCDNLPHRWRSQKLEKFWKIEMYALQKAPALKKEHLNIALKIIPRKGLLSCLSPGETLNRAGVLHVHACIPVAQEVSPNFPIHSSSLFMLGFHYTRRRRFWGNNPFP